MALPAGLAPLAVALMTYINAVSGLPIVPLDQLQIGVQDTPEGIAACYEDMTEVVFMRPDWENKSIVETSTLLHELVHALQDEAGLLDNPETRMGDMERQAYQIVGKWFDTLGYHELTVLMMSSPLANRSMNNQTTVAELNKTRHWTPLSDGAAVPTQDTTVSHLVMPKLPPQAKIASQ